MICFRKLLLTPTLVAFMIGTVLNVNIVNAEGAEAGDTTGSSTPVATPTSTQPAATGTSDATKAKQDSARAEEDQKNAKYLESLKNSTNHFDVDILNVGHESDLIIQGEHADNNIISKIITLFSQLLGIVAVGLYIIGAYFLITSQDEQGLQQGKDIFKFTSIGLIVAFLSYIIVQFIINIIFGIQ